MTPDDRLKAIGELMRDALRGGYGAQRTNIVKALALAEGEKAAMVECVEPRQLPLGHVETHPNFQSD